MIKVRTIGMSDRAVINPVLTSASPVANYSILTIGGRTYLIANTVTGDDAYIDDNTFAAGEYLKGYDLKAWTGEELVIDEKHITYGAGESYASLTNGKYLKAKTDGTLEITATAPQSGFYFKVCGKTTLTGKAVIATIEVGVGA
jgi:hypothetical protein